MEKILLNKTLGQNWISWFIGFCDAEANFQTFPKKRSYITMDGKNSNYYNIGYGFHLSLSIKDRDLLLNIHKNLNYLGNIYEYKETRQEIRLAITKLDDLRWLIENIFESSTLLTAHQRNRYNRLKYGVLNKFNRVETLEEYKEFINKSFPSSLPPFLKPFYLSNTFINLPEQQEKKFELDVTDKIFLDNWISGFINGEGSFSIHNKGYLVFYIEQAEKEVLALIKHRLNLGPQIVFRAKRSMTFKDTYALSISSKKDINAILKFFENPFLISLDGNKKLQFENWKTHHKKLNS